MRIVEDVRKNRNPCKRAFRRLDERMAATGLSAVEKNIENG
jgi:hypothetical protein